MLDCTLNNIVRWVKSDLRQVVSAEKASLLNITMVVIDMIMDFNQNEFRGLACKGLGQCKCAHGRRRYQMDNSGIFDGLRMVLLLIKKDGE